MVAQHFPKRHKGIHYYRRQSVFLVASRIVRVRLQGSAAAWEPFEIELAGEIVWVIERFNRPEQFRRPSTVARKFAEAAVVERTGSVAKTSRIWNLLLNKHYLKQYRGFGIVMQPIPYMKSISFYGILSHADCQTDEVRFFAFSTNCL